MMNRLREVVLVVVNRLLHHPHYPSIGVYSRLITNIASIAWSLDVLLYQGRLRGSPVPWVSSMAPEQMIAIACGLLFLGVFQSVWLFQGWKPLRWCSWSYGLIWAWWCFVTWLTLLGIDSAAPNLKAGLCALFTVSTFAWLSTPRYRDDGADHANPY